MKYFTLMLDPFLTGMPDVSENDGSSFRQGCSMSCLTMMLDWMFDRDAEISVRKGCWIERLTGMLDKLIVSDDELTV